MRQLFFFQAEDGIRDLTVTGVQTCALPISRVLEQTGGADPRSIACPCLNPRPGLSNARVAEPPAAQLDCPACAIAASRTSSATARPRRPTSRRVCRGVAGPCGARSEERRVGKE